MAQSFGGGKYCCNNIKVTIVVVSQAWLITAVLTLILTLNPKPKDLTNRNLNSSTTNPSLPLQ